MLKSVSVKQILQYPDKRLASLSSKITDFKEAKKIAEELIEVTKSVDRPWSIWLGMAAPQIGYNKRVILLKKSFENYTVMINPEIIEQKWRSLLPLPSRCFSLKGVYLIRDYFWVEVKYQDLEGKTHIEVVKGGRASTLQQEINHLNGVLLSNLGARIF